MTLTRKISSSLAWRLASLLWRTTLKAMMLGGWLCPHQLETNLREAPTRAS